MENWKKDSRKDIVMVDVDALVPPDHLLRKVERVMDYDWLYERLSPYYCADNGRPGTDPVVLIKMVLPASTTRWWARRWPPSGAARPWTSTGRTPSRRTSAGGKGYITTDFSIMSRGISSCNFYSICA